jgi:hypothetical protein
MTLSGGLGVGKLASVVTHRGWIGRGAVQLLSWPSLDQPPGYARTEGGNGRLALCGRLCRWLVGCTHALLV